MVEPASALNLDDPRHDANVVAEPVDVRWCVGCDAELAPPVRDRYAIQICHVCRTEQPHWKG